MRVARRDGLSARILLVAAFGLVFLTARPVVAADVSCVSMSPNMRSGYLALEDKRYADAEKAFTVALNEYLKCGMDHGLSPHGTPARNLAPLDSFWANYATAGLAAAAFGKGKIAEGLNLLTWLPSGFSTIMSGSSPYQEASADLRRAASDGLAYVRLLESAKKPLPPKIWLDWKAAHPSLVGPPVGSTPPARSSSVTVTTFDAPGATTSAVRGINNTGQIVGTFRDAGGKWHGYLRTAESVFTTIDVLDATETDAFGINVAGQIVGVFKDGSGKWHGYLRTAGGTFTTIDAPGAMETTANGINDAGQIVGTFRDAGSKWHGYLRTAQGAVTTIDVPGATRTFALGISAAGQIVGNFTDADNKFHGFLRTSGGTFTTIDAPGATMTAALGINAAGQVAGHFQDAGGKYYGYLRASGGTFTTFDAPGATRTYAYGINAAGQIVGAFTDAGGKEHGYIASPTR